MKFYSNNETVISSEKTNKFSMEVNSKSFSILSSGIYSNKIRAIIREYSTNAVDSHIEAGNPNPIDVHLPTKENPYFYVQDYGVGLDREDFENIFFKFFKSTKDHSDSYNGTLGLGSKSFVCYNTKSCVVESVKNGLKSVYSCFIGDEGIPEYSLLHEQDVNEHNGVKVTIPVDFKDINPFYNNAKSIYSFFDQKPNFVGECSHIEIPNIVFKDGYTLVNTIRKPMVVMGNVAYPIEYTGEYFPEYISTLSQNPLIKVDIGEVSFSPSRESLEYTNRTIKNIKNRLDKVIENAKKDILNKLKSAKSELQACIIYGNDKNKKLYNYDIKYNNKKLPNTLSLTNSQNIKYLPSYGSKTTYVSYVNFLNNPIFILDDAGKTCVARCKMFREKLNSSAKIYILTKDNLENFPLTYCEDDIILASSLPAPERGVNSKSKSNSQIKNKIYLLCNDNTKTYSWVHMDEELVNPNKDSYYVIKKNNEVLINNQYIHPKILYSFVKEIDEDINVYGIPPSKEKKMKEKGWKSFHDKLDEIINNAKKEYKQNKKLIDYREAIKGAIYTRKNFIQNLQIAYKHYPSYINKIEIFRNFYKTNESYLENIGKLDKIFRIERFYKRIYNKTFIDINKEYYSNQFEELKDRYNILYRAILTKTDLYFYLKGINHDLRNL